MGEGVDRGRTNPEAVAPSDPRYTGNTPGDVVISVPAYFTDQQRRAMMDAAAITKLKVLARARAVHEASGCLFTPAPLRHCATAVVVSHSHTAYTGALGWSSSGVAVVQRDHCDGDVVRYLQAGQDVAGPGEARPHHVH